MTIACTRCGASQEGDIIVPVLVFKFKHNRGCGNGVGPLAVLPSNKVKAFTKEFKEKVDPQKLVEAIEKSDVKLSPKGKIIDEPPKKSKSKIEKLKVFGKKD